VRRILLGGLAAGALFYGVAVQAPPGPRSLRAFDPDRMADLEVGMWQAYYEKERFRLFALLVATLREQNRYPWVKAVHAGFRLGRAASTFGDARSDYERVLPDLEAAYAIARDWTRAGFEPATVARSELAWWVARRQPGGNGVERVGGLIADEYALLYETPREAVLVAALRRAEAAALRDQGGDRADWVVIRELLRDSYRRLYEAVNGAGPGAPGTLDGAAPALRRT
jgi:hypothetical protein